MNEDPYCHLQCPRCGQAIDVLWEQLGQRVVCTACGEWTVAEAPGARREWTPTPPRKTWPAGMVLLVGGLLCLLVAAALWYISIQQPLEEMRRHVPRVDYSMKRIVFIPLFALSGAGMTLAGLLSPFFRNRKSGPPGRERALAVILLVLSMVPGWFLYNWFEGEMKKEGYERGMLGAQPRPIPVPKMNIPALDSRPDPQQFEKELREIQDKVRKEAEKAGR